MKTKITYDKATLLSLQFSPASTNKPDDLPDVAEILEIIRRPPGRLQPRPLPARVIGRGDSGFRPSIRPSIGEPGARRHFTLSTDVTLHKAKEAWRAPATGQKQQQQQQHEAVRSSEETKTQNLLNRVRGILNKLTPQKLQQLTEQVKALPVCTEGMLQGVVSIVFEKAVAEPTFSGVYASMCHCLAELQVPCADKAGFVTFRRLLLNRCKTDFDKSLDAAEREDKKKTRKFSLGLMRFIGELFKLKMLTQSTMDKCIIAKLLTKDDDESMECLCVLITSIGRDLDFHAAKTCIDRMEQVIEQRTTSPRVRFLLQDVVELRRNNWVPRRPDQGPKTIDQVHKEAEVELLRDQLKCMSPAGRTRYTQQRR